MKYYKLVRSVDGTTFEHNLNAYAEQGYELLRFDISPKGSYVAVMVKSLKETVELADDLVD